MTEFNPCKILNVFKHLPSHSQKKRTPPKRASGRGSAGSSRTGSRPGTPSMDSAATSSTLRAAASKLEQGVCRTLNRKCDMINAKSWRGLHIFREHVFYQIKTNQIASQMVYVHSHLTICVKLPNACVIWNMYGYQVNLSASYVPFQSTTFQSCTPQVKDRPRVLALIYQLPKG